MGLDRDASRPATGALGWHVHYEVGGRLRVESAASRDAAIHMARALLNENFEVLRLVGQNDGEIINAREIRLLCARTKRRGRRGPYKRRG